MVKSELLILLVLSSSLFESRCPCSTSPACCLALRVFGRSFGFGIKTVHAMSSSPGWLSPEEPAFQSRGRMRNPGVAQGTQMSGQTRSMQKHGLRWIVRVRLLGLAFLWEPAKSTKGALHFSNHLLLDTPLFNPNDRSVGLQGRALQENVKEQPKKKTHVGVGFFCLSLPLAPFGCLQNLGPPPNLDILGLAKCEGHSGSTLE